MRRKAVVSFVLVMMFLISVFPMSNFLRAADSGGISGDPVDWWSTFHHDLTHTGYSTSMAPTIDLTLWKYATGSIVESSPAVVGGVVYVGSEDDKVYAFGPVSQRTSYTLPLVVAGAIVIVAIALFIVAVVRRERKRRLPSESVLPGSENGVKGSQFLFSGS